MVVVITNISDEPGDQKVSPATVDVWNKTLAPGASMNLPAELVNQKVRQLEMQGLIAIGRVPPWYVRAKQRGRGRELSAEERQKRMVVPPPQAPVFVPEPAPVVPQLDFSEQVEPEEGIEIEAKKSKRR
jgi:hypothetical protein